MSKIKPGAGFTIFILFFGFALLDAIVGRHWLRILLWVLIGVAFLLFDNMGQRKKSKSDI
jgi:hypothetical protein